MVKKRIDGESKEQRKKRKALEKLQKLKSELVPTTHTDDKKYYVLCLKHGTKYSSDYVNKLYNMVKRYCTLNVEVVCLTDDSKGIDTNVTIIPLPGYLTGWWCKPYMFSKDLPLNGTILYLDLDIVISGNIDRLFLYKPESWCTIRDFTRKMRPAWKKYNSSVVRFNSGQLNHFWEDFKNDYKEIQKRFFGDQDWLYDVACRKIDPAELYPDIWVLSWKWEIRRTRDFKPGGTRGLRELRTIEHVEPPQECCIAVFHGDPNPERCFDPWVVNNWK